MQLLQLFPLLYLHLKTLLAAGDLIPGIREHWLVDTPAGVLSDISHYQSV